MKDQSGEKDGNKKKKHNCPKENQKAKNKPPREKK